MTITEVARSFDVSTRTLRYYEQIGLIKSSKKADYAYRIYERDAIRRLHQIIILRKLRISLKQIKQIFVNENLSETLDILEANISELNKEITAFETIRSILKTLALKVNECLKTDVKLDLLEDTEFLKIVEPLCLSKIQFKEEKTMEDLITAGKQLNSLKDSEVRIIYLPPATVASISCSEDVPEIVSGKLLNEFITETKLYEKKPDFRHYGFNTTDSSKPEGNNHCYERWVTIPKDLTVNAPFVKKEFEGGLYCAFMIPMGAFDEWTKFYAWVQNNEKYELDFKSEMTESECMEEHLDYIHKYLLSPDDSNMQIDLLLPIKERNNL